MIGSMQYKDKVELLSPFLEELCQGIKKEIRQEFIQKGRLQKGLGAKDVSQFFYKLIVEGGDEKTGEWLASSWVCRNGEIFQCFHEQLSLVDKNYENIESLSTESEEKIKTLTVQKFGYLRSYLFCVLNSVVFSKETFEELKQGAIKELSAEEQGSSALKKTLSIEELEKAFEMERKKLEEKYEKKLQGALKKCQLEVEGYRKQIGQLQKKLEDVRV